MLWSMVANIGAYVAGLGAHAAERGRAGAGGALRRRVPARRRRAGRARLEGHGVAAGPAGAARPLPRPRARATPRSPTTRGGAASRRRPRCRRTPGSCSSPKPSSPAPSAARRRGSWWPPPSRRTRCRSTKCGRCWTRPRRSSPTATSSSRSRGSSMAATAELRAANERLQELDRLKDDFVSTVTHELRTPLTSIRAFSEILHDNPGARRRRAAEVPQHHHPGERAADPPHQPGARPRQAGVRTRRVAGRARSTSGRSSRTRSTRRASSSAPRTSRLETRLPDGVPPVQRRPRPPGAGADQPAVERGEVRRGRRRARRRRARRATRTRCASRVTDNGPGIGAEDQQVIFEKFRQAGDTMTEKPQGTGLGLPISRQIIEHFGGRLWVRERAGRRRDVRLRAAGREAIAGARAERDGAARDAARRMHACAPHGAGGAMGKKILIADDEPNIVVSLEFLMKQKGYDVRVVEQRRGGARRGRRVRAGPRSCST